MKYGALPRDLGLIDINPVEMMFWLYAPIHTPSGEYVYPAENLWEFAPIVEAVRRDDPERFDASYVYLTAKVLWASGECGNTRPGWHSDGFGTDDRNYIWYDSAPTEFIEDAFVLSSDCANAMEIMTERARLKPVLTYPCKHLIALTPENIHRPPVKFEPGIRAFCKVSVSKDRYNLKGNSINYKLGETWPMIDRNNTRNHPAR